LLDQRAAGQPPPLFMSDALDRNVPKGHAVVEANCLSHGRRHVVDQAESFPDPCVYLLRRIRRIYRIDGLCRRFRLSPPQRLAVHQRWSQPVLDQLHAWMTAQLEDKVVEPNSGLGKAFHYFLKRWDNFTVFTRRAGAPLDNNISERALKMAIQHRNNSLFYRSAKGAAAGDIAMSIIHTAQLNGVNVLDYITELLRHATHVADDPANWLPWNYRATLARFPPAPTPSHSTDPPASDPPSRVTPAAVESASPAYPPQPPSPAIARRALSVRGPQRDSPPPPS
jgi:hypothetical protein